MKIGIITLSASFNCGSMLQSYALKKILEKYGDVEIINFSSEASHKMYDIVPNSLFERLRMKRTRGELLEELIIERDAYNKFRREMLGISGKEYFAKDLSKISSKYDIVVAGSDQVWNVCMSDFDEAFFCGWTNSKKVAYAPSLGGHDIRESTNANKIIECVKAFDCLSVREKIGQNCLEDIVKKEITKVLDPTLVYGEDNWKKIVGSPIVSGEYIFFYSWAYCYEELRQIVAQRSKETNLPVYVIDAHKWRKHCYMEDGFVLCKEAGPMAFLNLMCYAKECYVESFHGMVFAYIFRKNFWLLDTHENLSELDTRLREFVNLLNANDRILTKYNYMQKNIEEAITYGENENLRDMRKISLEYIERTMK